MGRGESVKIAPQPWMEEPATRAVLAALADPAGDPRFVGGAVRDALLGHKILDIDIATPLAPEEVVRRCAAAGIKVVPTGLAHGTLTAVVPPRHFEITTLRADVETYGRRARVQFIADWAADARRRDFTMNALFLDAQGEVYDYVGGLDDLRQGRVRFVGDAAARIREDVLRLLRFYRFHAHYGRGATDAAARAACRALAPLLPTLSAERVAAELLKLLAAPDPLPALRLMQEDGVLPVILPEAVRFDRLAAVIARERAPDPLRRLGALIAADAAGTLALAERLRLSNHQRERLLAMAAPPWPVDLGGDERAQRRALHHLGRESYLDILLLRAAEAGADAAPLLALAAGWQPPRLPVTGRDVAALGVPQGPRVGEILDAVAAWWEDGDFRADRGQCLAELKRRIG
jgi:poly(A) polymerase